MQVTVFGTGYVGLVTGAGLADVGHQVLCVDVDRDKIACLERGEIPIYEPGLDQLVARNVVEGRLAFSLDPDRAVRHGDVLMIAVGTPPDEDGSADLSHVLMVARTIGARMTTAKIVVNKSTVPVGTADRVRAVIDEVLSARGVALDFAVVSNPEFLKEGSALEDFLKPDRIIIGSDSAEAARRMDELYAPFNRNHQRMIHMDLRSAELTKYAANAMLATKISFMNELSVLAERLEADIERVRVGIGSDPRIGYQFIYPGCGYGGSCFPKDVRALLAMATEQQAEAQLLQAVQDINERQKGRLFEKLSQVLGDLSGRTIALWGLAFKPKTDDIREAPSLVLIEALLAAGARVRAYDPVAMGNVAARYGARIELGRSADQVLEDADALVICTEWPEFRAPDCARIRQQLRVPLVVDGRNLFEPACMAEAGLLYHAIGRPVVIPEAVA